LGLFSQLASLNYGALAEMITRPAIAALLDFPTLMNDYKTYKANGDYFNAGM
jgi:hypothetical protein